MSRKTDFEGGTKEKILFVAMQVFMENGYEKASVRTILEKADIVTGSFYHFFASKEELFEEVIAQYLTEHEKRVVKATEDDTLNFIQKVNAILNTVEESTGFYQKMGAQRLHWTIQYALRKKTILAILPEVERLVDKEIQENRASNPLQMDSNTLAVVLLQGIEGILHAKSNDEVDATQIDQEQIQKMKMDVISYTTTIMGLTKENLPK